MGKLQTKQNFLNMEFTLYIGFWEFNYEDIREFLKTHVLATPLTGNAWLYNGKKISCISGFSKLFQNFQVFGGVGCTDVMANLH